MEIESRTVDDVTVISLNGELSWATAATAQPQIIDAAPVGGKIILDMSGVTYMSSAGLRLLLTLYRQISAQSGQLVLTGLSADLQSTMELTGFLDFFSHAPTLEDGLVSLNS